ncbi:MAG: hypothetical protein ACLQIB_55365 [Isosphaeraceae bacterium]
MGASANVLGLTPQATFCRPFGAFRIACNGTVVGASANVLGLSPQATFCRPSGAFRIASK